MDDKFSREVGLLRVVVANLVQKTEPLHPDYIAYMRAQNVPLPSTDGITKTEVRPIAHKAFGELADCLVQRIPQMERGTGQASVLDELFSEVERLYGRDPDSIVANDAQSLAGRVGEWFEKLARPRRIFVPCVLTPHAAPPFRIGPVEFMFINDLATSAWALPPSTTDILSRRSFHDVLAWMREARGDWLARVSVERCEGHRAQEIGALSVDLAIVGLLLAAPNYGTREMCRLESRRGYHYKRTLVEQDGNYHGGWSRLEPGIAIGAGTLADILRKTEPLIIAVGNAVRSFASGAFRRPNLERAWCDAAYWLHEAVLEPIDSIAIAKLETALEVLLRAESSAGSTQRLVAILHHFFGLKPEDPIREGASVTARQFAARVVGDRSQILHGTLSTLHARMMMDRRGMEGFAIDVIRRAVLELETYCTANDTADSTQAFLDWLANKQPSV